MNILNAVHAPGEGFIKQISNLIGIIFPQEPYSGDKGRYVPF